jgi:hypothetical protein
MHASAFKALCRVRWRRHRTEMAAADTFLQVIRDLSAGVAAVAGVTGLRCARQTV